MTSPDDVAAYGEATGYVPCLEQAAAPAAPPDDVAIFGEAEGFVPPETGAAAFPDPGADSNAITGSAVGFVAKPCCIPSVGDFGFPFIIRWDVEHTYYYAGGAGLVDSPPPVNVVETFPTPGRTVQGMPFGEIVAQPFVSIGGPGDIYETETVSAVILQADPDALAAGATHIRIQTKIFGAKGWPAGDDSAPAAIDLLWAIWEGNWSGDTDTVPDFTTCKGVLLSQGTVDPELVRSHSLSGKPYDAVDLFLRLDVDGYARFVFGHHDPTQLNAGSSPVSGSYVTAPRYPNFLSSSHAQAGDHLEFQRPTNTTETEVGFQALCSHYRIDEESGSFDQLADPRDICT